MFARHEILGGFDGNRGIAAIGIRPDRLAEFLVERLSLIHI